MGYLIYIISCQGLFWVYFGLTLGFYWVKVFVNYNGGTMKINILVKETREKDSSLTKLSKKINVNPGTISDWIKGRYIPCIENREKLRDLKYSEECCFNPSKTIKI